MASSDNFRGSILFVLIRVILLYVVYLVEYYHSTARIQLARRIDVAAVTVRVHAMRTITPRVWWKAICYHYVRRKRQVTRYRNGDSYTTTQEC